MLLAVGAVLGLLAGLASGGSVSRLASVRLRWPILVLLALAVKELGIWGPLAARQNLTPWLYTASLVLLIAWTLWHTYRLPGVWLVSLGMALNLIVVLANGGHMPVRADLAHHGPVQLIKLGVWGQYMLEGPAARLSLLDDRITLPWLLGALFRQAYSVGDLVSLAGIFVVGLLASRQRHLTPPSVGKHPKQRYS